MKTRGLILIVLCGSLLSLSKTSEAGEANCLSLNLFGQNKDYCLIEGDANGDGRQEMIQYYDGLWSFSSVGGGLIQFGGPGYQPALGDWDGDGTDTPGLFKQGTWLLSNSTGHITGAQKSLGVDEVIQFGSPTGTPIAGDWTGSGKDSLGVVDGNGVFQLLDRNRTSGGTIEIQPLPGSNDPIVGDFDGDGDDEVGSAFGLGQFWWVNDIAPSRGGEGDITVTDQNECLSMFNSEYTLYTQSNQYNGLIGITSTVTDPSISLFDASPNGFCDPLEGVIIEIIP